MGNIPFVGKGKGCIICLLGLSEPDLEECFQWLEDDPPKPFPVPWTASGTRRESRDARADGNVGALPVDKQQNFCIPNGHEDADAVT